MIGIFLNRKLGVRIDATGNVVDAIFVKRILTEEKDIVAGLGMMAVQQML